MKNNIKVKRKIIGLTQEELANKISVSSRTIKAWKVVSRYTIFPDEYPIDYCKDDTGDFISYNNGIFTFH